MATPAHTQIFVLDGHVRFYNALERAMITFPKMTIGELIHDVLITGEYAPTLLRKDTRAEITGSIASMRRLEKLANSDFTNLIEEYVEKEQNRRLQELAERVSKEEKDQERRAAIACAEAHILQSCHNTAICPICIAEKKGRELALTAEKIGYDLGYLAGGRAGGQVVPPSNPPSNCPR